MIPSSKDPELEAQLEQMFGRTTAILNDVCIPPPVGCGRPVVFTNARSAREYTISGLCEECQLLAFGPREDDEPEETCPTQSATPVEPPAPG